MMINKTIKIFFITDLGVVLFCILMGELNWLLNTQIAFFSSLMVTVGSYLGYRKNIDKRVQNHENYDDDYDELDKMDDKYDLYSPQVDQEEKEFTKEEIKQEIDKSKQALKRNNIKNFVGSLTGMASLYRLAGYIGLIIGFFYLNNNGYLHIYSYVFGFIIVPISAIILSFLNSKQKT